MKILVIGAGAVGQVYGRHLAAAGHEITFFVKPRYAEEVSAGLVLHRLGYLRTRLETWRDYGVISSTAEIAVTAWDQIWLCVASDALRSELTREILARAGKATVVCLQPGPDDAGRIREQLASPHQVVQGLITFISYQSPLPGRPGPEGMAYYLSALAPGLFSGEADRVKDVVQALRKGGMAARAVSSLDEAGGGGEGFLIPLVAALELNSWELDSFGRSSEFSLGREAALEALSILERDHGARVGRTRLLLNPLASRALLALAPRVLPLALEPYLEYHFSKVGTQTRQMLDSYVRLGESHGLPTRHLQELRGRLS